MNEIFKPFDRVLVRQDNNTYWGCDLYSHSTDDLTMYCCVGGLYSQCIPYEGNEHLLGTTDELKPKRWRAERGETYWCVNGMGECMEVYDEHGQYGDCRYNIGNYFKTQEEAQAMAERFKIMLKGKKICHKN